MSPTKPHRIIFYFLFSILSLSVVAQPSAAQDDLYVHFIDVGYGDAIVIQFPNKAVMMIDAGKETEGQAVLNYLAALNIKHINAILITHPHRDHFGGFQELIKHVTVDRVYVNGQQEGDQGYGALLKSIEDKNIPIESLRRGSYVEPLDPAVAVDILSPKELTGQYNNDSIVTWLVHGRVSFLFTADIEPALQQSLIKDNQFVIKADCLKIPHHGWPMHDDFIDAFESEYCVLSTGKNNWSAPDEPGLEGLSCELLRTDKQGSIRFVSDGVRLKRVREYDEKN